MSMLRLAYGFFLMSVISFSLIDGNSVNSYAAEKTILPLSERDFDLAQTLKGREERVRQREIQLDEKERELKELEDEIETKLTSLVELQKKVEDELASLNQTQDEQFRYLIKIYKSMSLSKLTALLVKMDDPTVVRILRALQIETVAKILPKMEADRAVALSSKLGMLQKINIQ